MKSFLKRHRELEDIIIEKLDLLCKNPFDPKLRTHKLSGQLKNEYAASLTYEHRILFILEENNIYLTNIGSHDEVY
jgi:mRNA-degrading endonuclease YafQ of YafQ-DinJ toxin-antitoxin module